MPLTHLPSLRPHLLIALMVLCTAAAPTTQTASAQPISRDLTVDARINPLGYAPSAAKYITTPGTPGDQPVTFEVRRLPSTDVVHTGTLSPAGGDFGDFLVGDFSEVTEPGTYYITLENDPSRSYTFRIEEGLYEKPLSMILSYFAAQRCGASRTGYLSPCHLDDGVRMDNAEHQDVTGGWHDASDLRKWTSATIYGMIGLAKLTETLPDWKTDRILEELRWGNQYFLKMQEPAGYIMDHIGGDALDHGDSNRWTDNKIAPPGGSVHHIDSINATVVGSKDDRVIKTNRASDITQFNFIASQARMARLTRERDPAYSEKCMEAARRAMQWAMDEQIADHAGEYGALLQAAVAMHKATGEDQYRDLAAEYAQKLLQLQVTEPIDDQTPIRGFFQTTATDPKPYHNISRGRLPLLGLCAILETFPDHQDAPAWKDALAMHVRDYLSPMASRNGFGIVPFTFYLENPQGDRRIGSYWYRYFMTPMEGEWWVGINAHLASAGVGLMRAARILDDPRLAALAQRQLDWILGANPLGASTMEGVGYSQPERFINGGEFSPPTPRIHGGVMNGLGGTIDDQPALYDGSWQTAEYWTPMVSYTLWLMAELRQGM